MLVAFISQLVLIVLVLIYLLRRYASKSTPWGVLVIVLLSWIISFSAFIAMAADIYNVMKTDQLGTMDPLLKIYWQTFYWLSFLLSMYARLTQVHRTVLHLLHGFRRANDRSSDQRLILLTFLLHRRSDDNTWHAVVLLDPARYSE